MMRITFFKTPGFEPARVTRIISGQSMYWTTICHGSSGVSISTIFLRKYIYQFFIYNNVGTVWSLAERRGNIGDPGNIGGGSGSRGRDSKK